MYRIMLLPAFISLGRKMADIALSESDMHGRCGCLLIAYFHYSLYNCIVTQNAYRNCDHSIKSWLPGYRREASSVSCSTVLLFILWYEL